jgi:hypothetical protein
MEGQKKNPMSNSICRPAQLGRIFLIKISPLFNDSLSYYGHIRVFQAVHESVIVPAGQGCHWPCFQAVELLKDIAGMEIYENGRCSPRLS